MATSDVVRELIEAARPFAGPEPLSSWACHGGDPRKRADCGHCNRIKRLRAAIEAAETDDR
jgi:hypothetical protein